MLPKRVEPSSLVSTSDSCQNFVLRKIKQSWNDLHEKNKHKAHVLLRHSVTTVCGRHFWHVSRHLSIEVLAKQLKSGRESG